jgi:ribosomal protein S18 acetylase RimI-like enzyme
MASAGYKDALEIWQSLPEEQRKLVSPRGNYVDSPNLVYRYVKKVDNTPIGFIDAYNLKTGRGSSSRIAFIILAVRPDRQSSGVGKEMLAKAETNLRSKGYSELIYRVERTNIPSVALANSYGFQLKSETKNQYVFHKTLQQQNV